MHERDHDAFPGATQLELPIARERVPDRNHERGGRSFYFFDFDDNVMQLCTPIFLFDKESGAELALSTRRFSEVSSQVGRAGPWARYEVRDDDATGSFRRFRDVPAAELRGRPQPFVEDLLTTLRQPDHTWKGPSWDFFYHSIYNQRPVAIITARGHHPDTMRAGIDELRRAGHLPDSPHDLGIYPVSHRGVRAALGDPEARISVPALKKAAIIAAVKAAMEIHGGSPHHRFGVSDDDARNLEHILEALRELKGDHPENAFFVINASRRPVIKTEVLVGSTCSDEVPAAEQLALFA